VFGDVEHGDAAALGGGEIVHGWVFLLSETGFRRHQTLWWRQVKMLCVAGWKSDKSDRR
jgi:hypothetical protein